MSKYRNIKTVIDGIKFDSKREAQYYLYYKHLEAAGTIKNLVLQYPLQFIYNGKKMFKYIADFYYEDDYGAHYIDVKGVQTAVFKLKKKLIEAQHNITIEIME